LPHLGLIPITRPLLIGPGAALTTSCLVAPVMAIPASMGTWVVLKTRKLVTFPSLEVCPMLAGLLARACFNHSAMRPILELIHGITPQPTLNWLLPAPPLPPPIARDATLASVAGKHSAGLAIYVDTARRYSSPTLLCGFEACQKMFNRRDKLREHQRKKHRITVSTI
jgi:hypothetical protein